MHWGLVSNWEKLWFRKMICTQWNRKNYAMISALEKCTFEHLTKHNADPFMRSSGLSLVTNVILVLVLINHFSPVLSCGTEQTRRAVFNCVVFVEGGHVHFLSCTHIGQWSSTISKQTFLLHARSQSWRKIQIGSDTHGVPHCTPGEKTNSFTQVWSFCTPTLVVKNQDEPDQAYSHAYRGAPCARSSNLVTCRVSQLKKIICRSVQRTCMTSHPSVEKRSRLRTGLWRSRPSGVEVQGWRHFFSAVWSPLCSLLQTTLSIS